MQKHPASFFTFFTELAEGKCNRQELQYSKTTCGRTGMEPGFVPEIHFARYDRRELDTYYRARGWKQPFGVSARFPAGMEVLPHLD
jgi:hypothetical protein